MFYVSPSIKEAFKNGSGDVCWKNEFGFVFISRHDDPEKIRNQGFQIVPYEDVLKIDSEQNPKKESPAPVIEKAPVVQKKFIHWQGDSYTDSFYMEYPDAYGQNL